MHKEGQPNRRFTETEVKFHCLRLHQFFFFHFILTEEMYCCFSSVWTWSSYICARQGTHFWLTQSSNIFTTCSAKCYFLPLFLPLTTPLILMTSSCAVLTLNFQDSAKTILDRQNHVSETTIFTAAAHITLLPFAGILTHLLMLVVLLWTRVTLAPDSVCPGLDWLVLEDSTASWDTTLAGS